MSSRLDNDALTFYDSNGRSVISQTTPNNVLTLSTVTSSTRSLLSGFNLTYITLASTVDSLRNVYFMVRFTSSLKVASIKNLDGTSSGVTFFCSSSLNTNVILVYDYNGNFLRWTVIEPADFYDNNPCMYISTDNSLYIITQIKTSSSSQIYSFSSTGTFSIEYTITNLSPYNIVVLKYNYNGTIIGHSFITGISSITVTNNLNYTFNGNKFYISCGQETISSMIASNLGKSITDASLNAGFTFTSGFFLLKYENDIPVAVSLSDLIRSEVNSCVYSDDTCTVLLLEGLTGNIYNFTSDGTTNGSYAVQLTGTSYKGIIYDSSGTIKYRLSTSYFLSGSRAVYVTTDSTYLYIVGSIGNGDTAGIFLNFSQVDSNGNVSRTTSSMSLPNSQANGYVLRYNKTNYILQDLVPIPGLITNPSIRFDNLGNFYLSGKVNILSSSPMLDFYGPSGVTSSSFTLPLSSTPTITFYFNKSGILQSYVYTNLNYTGNTTIDSLRSFIDNENNYHLFGTFTTPTTSGSFSNFGSTTGLVTWENVGYAKWNPNGELIYNNNVQMKGISTTFNQYDLANKYYADKTIEFVNENYRSIGTDPSVISILLPISLTSRVSNSYSSNCAPVQIVSDIDKNVYVLSAQFYNYGNTSTLNNLTNTIITKFTNSIMTNFTVLFGCIPSNMSVDASGNIFLSCTYDSTVSINIYDFYTCTFTTSPVFGLVKCQLPAGERNAIIKWASDGSFDSYTSKVSPFNQNLNFYGRVGPINTSDNMGNLYSIDNGYCGPSYNFTNNSVTGGAFGFPYGATNTVGLMSVSSTFTPSTTCSSVAIWENTLVLGSITAGSGVGCAYVYVRGADNLWSLQATLVGSGNVGNSNQGFAVSIYQDTIAVGGPSDNSNVGATWIFQRYGTTWVQVGTKLVGSNGYSDSQQGFSLSIYKDMIAIGGPADVSYSSFGRAWVFGLSYSTGLWTELHQLNNITGNIARFGYAVALYENHLVISEVGVGSSSSRIAFYNVTRTSIDNISTLVANTSIGVTLNIYKNTLSIGQNIVNAGNSRIFVFKFINSVWTYTGTYIYTGGINSIYSISSCALVENSIFNGAYSFDLSTNLLTNYNLDSSVQLPVDDINNQTSIYMNNQIGSIITVPFFTNDGAIPTTVNDPYGGIYTINTVSGYKSTFPHITQVTATMYENNTTGITQYVNGNATAFCPVNAFVSKYATTDYLGNLYITGILTNTTITPIFNLMNSNNVSPTFTIKETSGGTAIIKWSSMGIAQNYTYIRGVSSPIISVDPSGTIYLCGNYSGTSSAVYNFGQTLGASSVIMPTSGTMTSFISKWASSGRFIGYSIVGPTSGSFSECGTIKGLVCDSSGNAYMATNYTAQTITSLYDISTTATASTSMNLIATNSTSPSWTTTGSLATGRSDFTSVKLMDGSVLVAGGRSDASCELYNPILGTWSTTGSMKTARSNTNAIVLGNGNVFISGGLGTSTALSRCEVYDPNLRTWSTVNSMTLARYNHQLKITPNGSILIAGGQTGANSATTSCEIYNPYIGTWYTTGSMNIARTIFTLDVLSNGNLLASGGITSGNTIGTFTSEIYNYTTGTWTTTGNISTTSGGVSYHVTNNNQGNILLVGNDISSMYKIDRWINIPSPTTGIISYANMCTLSDGLTLLAGGITTGILSIGGTTPATNSCYVYNSVSNSWITTASLSTARAGSQMIQLDDGRPMIISGNTSMTSNSTTTVCEIYNPTSYNLVIIKWNSYGRLLGYTTINNTLKTSQMPSYNVLSMNDDQLNVLVSNGYNSPLGNFISNSSVGTTSLAKCDALGSLGSMGSAGSAGQNGTIVTYKTNGKLVLNTEQNQINLPNNSSVKTIVDTSGQTQNVFVNSRMY